MMRRARTPTSSGGSSANALSRRRDAVVAIGGGVRGSSSAAMKDSAKSHSGVSDCRSRWPARTAVCRSRVSWARSTPKGPSWSATEGRCGVPGGQVWPYSQRGRSGRRSLQVSPARSVCSGPAEVHISQGISGLAIFSTHLIASLPSWIISVPRFVPNSVPRSSSLLTVPPPSRSAFSGACSKRSCGSTCPSGADSPGPPPSGKLGAACASGVSRPVPSTSVS
ncbi:hypothetical protein ABIA39_008684 [Nocardia sp. GAS34]